MGGGGVVFVVADHRRRLDPAAQFADQAEAGVRVGLSDRKAVAAGDPVEQRKQAEAFEHGVVACCGLLVQIAVR